MADKYIEQIDGKDVNLGSWCRYIRSTKNGTLHGRLTKEMEEQLNKIGFIWNEKEYRFENKIKAVADYCRKFGKYPSASDSNIAMNSLGHFIIREKSLMRNDKCPEWKKEIINKYLPNFCCDTNSDMYFNKFLYYVKLYKKRFGHINIKARDVIDGYNIGSKWNGLNKLYKNKMLSENKTCLLMELGMFPGYKYDKQFINKMEMARRAVKEGIIIDTNNKKYKEVNLYDWVICTVKRRYNTNKLSNDDILVIEKLIGKSLHNLFNNNGDYVKAVDFANNEIIAIYKSQKEATRKINERYNVKMSNTIIHNRVNGKVTTPYKGRFMFYYATDEEVKKYLEENKAN